MKNFFLFLKNIKSMTYRRFIINSHLKTNFLPLIQKEKSIYDLGGKKSKKTYFLNEKNIFEKNSLKTINNDPNENADIIGDAENLPFKDNFLSSLIFIETIQYLKNPERSIKEIKRVLKKNGIAAISFPFLYNQLEDHTDRYRFTKKIILEYAKDFESYKIFNCGGSLSTIGQIIQTKAYNSKNIKRIFFYYLSMIIFLLDILFNDYNSDNIYTNGYLVILKK